ncbi:hypothetical protein Aab01nite_84470 [Paractinoplanes abujensis]|uniref:Uncharacterized protein n=1 Tax=Paractinoplanes abujensis TaxID=882441 RepID=A0A7W7G2D3_9ACTN|nr:hypothetical protein [Actinoplanes abujensis]MBB4693070.1 hypothetical protein [Actinoplanes abujensis]GID24857.1 hypothetical protein Aab01nite_84470 [Actinoplanes abujensis]
MTSLDELRRTLEQGADRAPDATGLVEQARAGAARLRRRNRMRAIAAAVVAVVLAVSVPSFVRLRTAEPPPNPAGPLTYYRQPYELTLKLAPSKAHFAMVYGTQGTTQFVIARPIGNPKNDSGGSIAAYDPGTFDPTRLRRGEPVTVQGRPAFWVEHLEEPAPASSGPGGGQEYRVGAAVGWQDPSGVWVTVSEGFDRASTLRLAESVRLTSPRTVRSPVRFGWVPQNLPVSYADARDVAEHGVEAHIGFGRPERSNGRSGPFFMIPYDTPLSVMTSSMDGIMTAWGEDYAKRPMRVINGYKTWYFEGTEDSYIRRNSSQMMIEAGSCGVTVVVHDRDKISYAELERMVQNMTFHGCENADGWQPAVGP